MNLISPKKTARRKVTLSLVLFILVTLGIFGGLFIFIKKEGATEGFQLWWQMITVGKGSIFLWLGSMGLWLYFRWRYRVEYKQ